MYVIFFIKFIGGFKYMTYPEVFSRLTYETAVIVFLKKDGTVRVMLGTRNLQTIELAYGFQGQVLGGHDKRCNINNGNIAVYDLGIGDARQFHIDRLISIDFVGEVKTKEQYDKVFADFVKFKTEYEKTQPMEISMDMFDK